MSAEQAALEKIIISIGEHDFPERVADALCQFTGFTLSAVFSHKRDGATDILFENLHRIGCRTGVRNYVQTTRHINPMLLHDQRGAVRARDFATTVPSADGGVRDHIIASSDEELGYRTIGWPERHEEIGLYFDGHDGVVEFGLYRERARTAASARIVQALDALRAPVAAAFVRHGTLMRQSAPSGAGNWPALLTGRERQIGDLLLAGYASEAIALRLGISRHTVKDHRKNIFRKLRISSLAELFAIAR
jgi:DNA-binding CsgD family transcriptional regulator